MKKITTLTISMLMISSIFAVDKSGIDTEYEQVRTRVGAAQASLQEKHKTKSMIESQIQKKQQELKQIQGKPEYAADYEKRQAEIRSLMDQYNSLVDECKSAIDHLGKELHSVSHKYIITGENGSYDVRKAAYKKPAPIVHKLKQQF